jgi:hypothetical protein
MSLDDWTQFVCLKDFGNMLPISSPERGMEVFRAEFDSAWRHGGLWISVWHPFVSGRSSRCDAMIRLIEYMISKGQIWFARLDEIAAHAKKCAADGLWKPRVDQLPFYESPIPGVLSGRGVLAD